MCSNEQWGRFSSEENLHRSEPGVGDVFKISDQFPETEERGQQLRRLLASGPRSMSSVSTFHRLKVFDIFFVHFYNIMQQRHRYTLELSVGEKLH